MEIENNTPFAAQWTATTDQNGRDAVIVVTKATFDFNGAGELTPAAEQVAIEMGDVHRGKPGESSVLWESDLALEKTGVDIIMLGEARAPGGSATKVDVTLAVGTTSKTIRVFGDRQWKKGVFGVTRTKPKPFETMPLIYERAYGGKDDRPKNPKKHREYESNPVGTGFVTDAKYANGVNLPNLEDPRRPIRNWASRPPTTGFGFYGRHWSPRKNFVGTYDDEWQETRCPLLPKDFDARYFNAAHPDLISSQPLCGGEPILVENAHAVSPLRMFVPRVELVLYASLGSRLIEQTPALDTLVIDTDASRLILVLRTSFTCHRQILKLGGFRLDLRGEP
jgi:hypothetical protein